MIRAASGDPENPHNVSNAARWLFLIILFSLLVTSFLAYVFRRDLLLIMGEAMLYFVILSISLGVIFVVYRILKASKDRLAKRR